MGGLNVVGLGSVEVEFVLFVPREERSEDREQWKTESSEVREQCEDRADC